MDVAGFSYQNLAVVNPNHPLASQFIQESYNALFTTPQVPTNLTGVGLAREDGEKVPKTMREARAMAAGLRAAEENEARARDGGA